MSWPAHAPAALTNNPPDNSNGAGTETIVAFFSVAVASVDVDVGVAAEFDDWFEWLGVVAVIVGRTVTCVS